MTSQVVFNLDSKVKAKAMKKAEREGVPFAAVLKLAAKAYADDQFTIGMVREGRFNPRTRREITTALKDARAGKNVSPRFGAADDAVAWLTH